MARKLEAFLVPELNPDDSRSRCHYRHLDPSSTLLRKQLLPLSAPPRRAPALFSSYFYGGSLHISMVIIHARKDSLSL